MAEPDKRPVTLEELLVSSLAQTDALAKLMIEKRLLDLFACHSTNVCCDPLRSEESHGIVNARSVRLSGQPGYYARPNRTLP